MTVGSLTAAARSRRRLGVLSTSSGVLLLLRSSGRLGLAGAPTPAAPTMTDDLLLLATLLNREHWRVESVTVRLHVLRMAVNGDWPGSIDDADAGLTDAIDRLRRDELGRAVVATGCATQYGLPPEPTLEELVRHAPAEVAVQLLTTADALADAIAAAHAAADEIEKIMQEAAYAPRPGPSLAPVVSPTRATVITRLVQRVVPDSLERFLGHRAH